MAALVESRESRVEGRKFGAVILAAGRSSRMGQPKMLLPWGDTSVLGHLIRVWRTLGAAPVVVVVRADDAALLAELDRLVVPASDRVLNPDPDRGMFSSIQCAARWEGKDARPTHWALVLGDQPQIRVEALRELLAFATAEPRLVCHLSRNGRPKHPVILPEDILLRLRETPHLNLKEFLTALPEPPALRESGDAGLDLDIDTPAEYERAKALNFGAGRIDR